MTTQEPIEAEVVEETPAQPVPVPDPPQNVALARTVGVGAVQAKNATTMVKRAAEIATALKDIISQQNLFSVIQGKEYVKVEGWQTCANMLGFVPVEIKNGRVDERLANGAMSYYYVAEVELRGPDGRMIARASAECGSEGDGEGTTRSGERMIPWKERPAPAQRSMAATRATSKACRLAFAWVMALAGYETTPAEEMDNVGVRRPVPQGGRPAAPPQQAAPAQGGGTALDWKRVMNEVPCPRCNMIGGVKKSLPQYTKPGKEWYCHKKEGGCGASFSEDAVMQHFRPAQNVTPSAPTAEDIMPGDPAAGGLFDR